MVHRADDRAGTDAGERAAVDGGSGLAVVADDERRAGDLGDAGDAAERNHLAILIADLQLADLRRTEAEARVALQIDLPRAAELVEVVRVVAAEIQLEREEDFVEGDSHRFAADAVDVDVHLRRSGAEGAKEA